MFRRGENKGLHCFFMVSQSVNGRENLCHLSVNKEAELKSAFCQHRHVYSFK